MRIVLRAISIGGVVCCVVASAGGSVYATRSVVRLRQDMAQSGAQISGQLTTTNTALATYEAELLTLRQQQENLVVATTRTATVSTPPDTKSSTSSVASTPTNGAVVNINTASKESIMSLPGIGSTYADRIIAARPFSSINQLLQVKGIGDKTFEKLRSQVTVD